MADQLKFPHLQKSIEDFLLDEEGNIPRNKILAIGSMMIVLGVLFADNAFAAHRSHSSHRSHTSHSSGSGSRGSGGYHSSHQSHQSHQSHVSSSGSTHGNSAHSNSAPSYHNNPSGDSLRLVEQGTRTNTAPSTRSYTESSSMSAAQNLSVGWQYDGIGWWWRNADGSYPVSTWKWLDGNNDGVYESYCFDGRGYLYTNTTTPDGFTVNSSGAWVQNGVVQTK